LYTTLALVFTIAIAITLEIARHQPAPPDTSLLTRANCVVPCTFGIIPGTTDRQDAQFAIEQATNGVYDMIGTRRLSFTVDDAAGRLIGGDVSFGFMGDLRVGTIAVFQVESGADLGQLGDLLLAGYTPRRVIRSCEGITPRLMGMTFGYEDRLSIAIVVDEGLTHDAPITILELRAPNIDFDTALANVNCFVETRWQGFAPLWRYFTLAR
jgi:hypothetical protein